MINKLLLMKVLIKEANWLIILYMIQNENWDRVSE